MKKHIFHIAVSIILLTNIAFSIFTYAKLAKPTNQFISNTSNQSKIYFEVSNFDLKYENTTRDESSKYKNESYKGTGIITCKGDEKLIKNPYLVLLKINRLKGGLATDTENEFYKYINVINGIGKFETLDSAFFKSDNLIKPEYKFEILGYTEFKQ